MKNDDIADIKKRLSKFHPSATVGQGSVEQLCQDALVCIETLEKKKSNYVRMTSMLKPAAVCSQCIHYTFKFWNIPRCKNMPSPINGYQSCYSINYTGRCPDFKKDLRTKLQRLWKTK